MCIFHFQLIDLDLWNTFCDVSPRGNFFFVLQGNTKNATLGMWWRLKIRKLSIGIPPINFTFSGISPKLQRSPKAKCQICNEKNVGFHLKPKNTPLPVEPWGMRMWSEKGPIKYKRERQFTLNKTAWQLLRYNTSHPYGLFRWQTQQIPPWFYTPHLLWSVFLTCFALVIDFWHDCFLSSCDWLMLTSWHQRLRLNRG